ncbi:porin [Anaeromyxobacter oryzae]|uniref:Porin domain-containing protein n=1 Tax=Anaeromyxobacter oryzae TaxID=2918170 RepID=A0ABM7WXE7_9BACT|nr:porin [Anaeromyxobacter oryzae]BDG04186.1 hypothetical protein AMOR_31820 [Anaeromyxobacter oryzae]
MIRTLAAITAALLALAARAQETQPAPPPLAPPANAPPPASAPPAPTAQPVPAPPQAEPGVPGADVKPKASTPNVVRIGKKATVSLGGRFWGGYERVSATGATAGAASDVTQRNRVTNFASYLRFAADLDLGAGFKGFAQLETQFALDGVTAHSPFDSGRNTGVGLKSPLGQLMVGRWDSPYKRSTSRLDPQDITGIGSYQNILGQITSAADTSDNYFDARLGNGVQYWTPTFYGLSAKVGYVGNESRTATLNPHVLSAAATYEGPIYLSVAWEERKDCIGVDSQAAAQCGGSLLGGPGKDRALRAGAGFSLDVTHTELGVVFERIDAKNDAGLELRRDAYFIGLTQGLGGDQHQLLASFGLAQDAKGNALASNKDTGAYYYTAGYQFYPAKDFNLYAFYTTIVNDRNAAYRFASKGFSVKNGANPEGISVGARFLF